MIAREFVDTSTLSHDQWLDMRRKGIGGSDVAAILGFNKWKSAVGVYLEKIGQAAEQEDNEAMEHGRDLEEYIRIKFAQRSGKQVVKVPFMYQHSQHPFLLANIDGWVPDEKAGLECKNVSEWRRGEWEDNQVPSEYLFQCNHYMSVFGCKKWYVCAFIGGNKIEIREIDRDDELIEMINQRLVSFWNDHVIPQIPPAFMAQDTAYLNGLYRQSSSGSAITITNEQKALITKARAFKQAKKNDELQYTESVNQLKGLAGTNELIYDLDGNLIATWKADKNGKRTFKIVGGDE